MQVAFTFTNVEELKEVLDVLTDARDEAARQVDHQAQQIADGTASEDKWAVEAHNRNVRRLLRLNTFLAALPDC